MERLADPVVVIERRLDPHVVRIRPQKVGPLVGPVIRKLWLHQQAIDQPGSLVDRGVGKKRSRFVRSWNTAADVRCGTTQKRVILTNSGRSDVQSLQFVPDQLIDKILSRQLSININRDHFCSGNHDITNSDLPHKASHNRGIARDLTGCNQSPFVHRSNRCFV